MTQVCVSGVWPEGSDGTDINALIRSHNRKVIALADDFCKVHLFAYPSSRAKVRHTIQSCSLLWVFRDQHASVCVYVCSQAPSHKYSAHSSHVTNVSFLYRDSHLISTGGKDMSIMQWRLVEKTSLSLTDGLLSNPAPPQPESLLTPPSRAAATPTQEPAPPATTNGTQDGPSPDTPPPTESTPPPSDSTVSLKDSLEPSDDTATPSDEGLPPLTPPS